ncbi:hypothetical protein ZWY2020_016925 [Hordeum vulgare]|nr:hypothetical protein ZWY2020_016925 [Hordeum vulgare]
MKPVMRRTESRVRVRSRPLSVRPWPEHTEDAALRRAISTCGGSTSPSSSSPRPLRPSGPPEAAGISIGCVNGRRSCAHAAHFADRAALCVVVDMTDQPAAGARSRP